MAFIYQNRGWPHFTWDAKTLEEPLAAISRRQGRLIGRMEALGFSLREEAVFHTLTQDVLKSSEIEGERLDIEQVRSSLARHLGIDIGALTPTDRHVDGVVEMMLDATQHYDKKLSDKRLFGWHSALFPTGHSGLHRIGVGAWRNDKTGPMQVVSGPLGRERVHFEATPAAQLKREMKAFLAWFDGADSTDPVLRAGIAHLWFVTIHPFDDGNGRIARAIADMALARAEQTAQRFYSMSAQIMKERKTYYDLLETTQRQRGLDITPWLRWFLECLGRACDSAETILDQVLRKARFWRTHAAADFNPRQRDMLGRLLDGFDGKLTSTKWAKLQKCSPDTALRDISDLLARNVLIKNDAGGRSTSYLLAALRRPNDR